MSDPGRWDIIGHRRAVDLLRHSIAEGRISHAYLFSGPRQIGKHTVAASFARALNCTGSPAPCGECRACRGIARGNYPDVRVLRLDEPTRAMAKTRSGGRRVKPKNIPIEDVRELLRDLALAPYEARWKVYIVRYAEDLSLDAVQTLLKTLEEPPKHVVLTLTTVDANILPPTVVSRCQRITLGPVPAAVIATALQDRYQLPEERARLLARLSEGRVGWAIEAGRDDNLIAARAQRLGTLVQLLRAGRFERLALAEQMAAEFGREPESSVAALELWLGWWRDMVLTKLGVRERVINHDRERELAEHGQVFALVDLIAAMKAIKSTLVQLRQNVNPRLALEVLVLGMPTGVR